MPGFGTQPPGLGPKGFRADQPPPVQSDDIHRIAERYCGPATLSPQVFSFAANQGQVFQAIGTKINAFILTVATGTVFGYFGDNGSAFGKAATTPHFLGSATIVANSQVFPISPGENYTFTLQEGAGATATGTITFIYQ